MESSKEQSTGSSQSLVSEKLERTKWQPAGAPPADYMAAWSPFKASWTEHELNQEIGAWSRPRAAEFIAMTAQTVGAMFESPEDAGVKSLITFAFCMREAGCHNISVDAGFDGSIFGCLREAFHFEAHLLSTEVSAQPSVAGSTRSGILEDTLITEAHEKMAPLWSDAQGCLALWDALRTALSDRDGTDSARAAALLLVHFEYLSGRNIGKAESKLIRLTDTDDQGAQIDTELDLVTLTSRTAPRILAAAAPRARI